MLAESLATTLLNNIFWLIWIIHSNYNLIKVFNYINLKYSDSSFENKTVSEVSFYINSFQGLKIRKVFQNN